MKNAALFTLLLFFYFQAEAQNASTMSGDIGLGLFVTPPNVLGKSTQSSVLPYTYFDYGVFFSHVDTLGFKLLPLGAGSLNLVGRVTFDEMDAQRGLDKRENSRPIGIGTEQKTPLGILSLNAFVDANQSHGTLLEAIYGSKLSFGSAFSFYPQLGMERRSSSYNNYFYGVTPSESAASGIGSYQASASNDVILGLTTQARLIGNLYSNLTLRRTWLGSGISDSPIVHHSYENSLIASLTYHIK